MSISTDARVTASPNMPFDDVLKVVRGAQTEVGNLQSQSTRSTDLATNYLCGSTRTCGGGDTGSNSGESLRTRGYWAIHGAPARSDRLAETEIADRQVVLSEVVLWLEDTIKKWRTREGKLVVADTSVFCHHEHKVENNRLRCSARPGLPPHPLDRAHLGS